MKTYCKELNITDISFIRASVWNCLEGKWHKRKTIRFLANFENMTTTEIEDILTIYGKDGLSFIVDHISECIRKHIINRDVSVPPIIFKNKYDINSCKWREIGVEHMLQQCYEYVAVDACKDMFQRKIGRYQCASIPKRGQIYGMKTIRRWLKSDQKGTRYFVKLDIQKCYPSIQQSLIKKYLHRDIKNDDLLYLLDTLINTFTKGGLSIGSHLSQWLCNYYLSYAYHYMDQDLHIKRRGKQTRLITHMLFYMDDIIIFSGNKKHLQLAVEKIIEYFQTDLGLKIKPKWNVNKVQYTDKNNDKHGVFIDMMGFKIYREGVAIRKTISIKISRKMRRVRKKIKNHQRIYPKEAFQVSSYNGWVKNTNSKYFYYHYEMWLCLPICKEVISSNMRSMYYQNFNKKYELINQKGDYYGEKLQGIYNS